MVCRIAELLNSRRLTPMGLSVSDVNTLTLKYFLLLSLMAAEQKKNTDQNVVFRKMRPSRFGSGFKNSCPQPQQQPKWPSF